MEVDGIADELGRQKEENRMQHEEIVSLTAKLSETELRLARLMTEHDEVGQTLLITRDNQNILAQELAEFKDRYAEVHYFRIFHFVLFVCLEKSHVNLILLMCRW